MWYTLGYLLGLVTRTLQNGSKLGLIQDDLIDEKRVLCLLLVFNKVQGPIHSLSSSSETRFVASLLKYFTSLQHEQIKSGDTFATTCQVRVFIKNR